MGTFFVVVVYIFSRCLSRYKCTKRGEMDPDKRNDGKIQGLEIRSQTVNNITTTA
jgi:hypothetical protein